MSQSQTPTPPGRPPWTPLDFIRERERVILRGALYVVLAWFLLAMAPALFRGVPSDPAGRSSFAGLVTAAVVVTGFLACSAR